MLNEKHEEIMNVLKLRFQENMNRHKYIEWKDVEQKLLQYPLKIKSLYEMEDTGGKPDVVGYDKKTGEFIFYDCSKETPQGRRNLCYDNEALESRKKFKPKDSALNIASAIGIELLTEDEYKELQKLGEFDTKTSSWLKTPHEIRKLGGALFADRRFNRVFIYHNGAESYYGVRGFRGSLRV